MQQAAKANRPGDNAQASPIVAILPVQLDHMMMTCNTLMRKGAVLPLHCALVPQVYWTTGMAPDAGRFFIFIALLFIINQMAIALFRALAAIARNFDVANRCVPADSACCLLQKVVQISTSCCVPCGRLAS